MGKSQLRTPAVQGTASLMAVLVAAVGCGGGTENSPLPPPPPPPPSVATVDVTPGAAQLVVGSTVQLNAVARDGQGNAISGKSFTWSSSSPAVATVSSSGLVAGVAAGNATITATVDGRSGSATATVLDIVDRVDVSPAQASVLQGARVALTATARNAAGGAISGKTFTWSSSNSAVATVSGSGEVTTLAPGTATITASVDGKSGSAAVEVVDPMNIPTFTRPFPAGTTYWLSNYHDHDIPRAFFDNGRKVTFWDERYDIVGYEGHQGYDWRMPEGTPILAVADGTVITTSNPAFSCPLLGREIPADGNGHVSIEHRLPGGVVVRVLYAHLSRKDVSVGQAVTAGQTIGLSGNVGCSLNPHLHFEVVRMTQTNGGQPAPIDPYGWEGQGQDPWLADPQGAASIRLWKPGEAPELFVRYFTSVNQPGGTLFFGITTVQPMGYRDAANPNNEYVEVSRDPAFAPASLDIAGATLRTRVGTVYTFPPGSVLSPANPTIRVYTGAGTNTAGVQYMGRGASVYDNMRECVQVFNAGGVLRNGLALGANGCA